MKGGPKVRRLLSCVALVLLLVMVLPSSAASEIQPLVSAPTWTKLSPSGSAPPARAAHTAIYDRASKRMVVFGGIRHSTSSLLDDLWNLVLSAPPAWGQLLPSSGPVPRFAQAAIYDGPRQRMIVFGGQGGIGGTSSNLNDVWALSLNVTPPTTSPPGAPSNLMVTGVLATRVNLA